ncbi:hypothetical protein O181_132056, partial [Austropuccinia psidii MF-1]|nr:hypothetical protein [Austropuccinia psidii MF-1]
GNCHNHKDGPPSMGVAATLTWNQFGANWPQHIFYGQLVPSGALWPFGHIVPSLASLANFHITKPQAFIFDFGPGGPLRLLWPVGQLAPFWPNPMRPRGRPSSPQGQVGPKPQLDPNLAKNPLDTKMAIEPIGPSFWPSTTMNHYSSHGLWQRPEAPRPAQQAIPST